jgi:ribonucleoside-diphosphate reductase alpha chain
MQVQQVNVVKRDKSTQNFNSQKIIVAIRAAAEETGLKIDFIKIAHAVISTLLPFDSDATLTVEQIQDEVERQLMAFGHHDVAKAYILHRAKHAELREARLDPDTKWVSEYIFTAKYARYIPEELRRETWDEAVNRVRDMHLRKYPTLVKEINLAFEMVRNKIVLPSMRALQFGGKAVEENHLRQYNCSGSAVDRPRFFAEAFYLLLCGCGVGYSVSKEYINRLPSIKTPNTNSVTHHEVQDTIEGWAEALDTLITSYFNGGAYIEFNYSKIRPEGTLLKTSGGRAPGHIWLKKSFELIRIRLDNAVGRQLRPIEAHDIVCIAADAVLSGGIRRSSLLCMFDIDDEEMIAAKTGNWNTIAPWRRNANNSAAAIRGKITRAQFAHAFKNLKEFGEPGFIFSIANSIVYNPCSEAAFFPFTNDGRSGFQFCNLTTINGKLVNTKEDFRDAVWAATFIGTLQAGYTDYKFLTKESREITERDALLGVSICGVYENPDLLLNANVLEEMSTYARHLNTAFAFQLGINQAARICLMKPEGTSSLLLGCIASGAHQHPARRFIRHVTCNRAEVPFQYFKDINPHAVKKVPWKETDYVIAFPVKVSDKAILIGDVPALQHLEDARTITQSWIIPSCKDGLNHNVSLTVSVKPSEWEAIENYLWENKDFFGAVSFIPEDGGQYELLPRYPIRTSADEAEWNYLISNWKEVDWQQMVELEDGTCLTGENACQGGACER